MTPSHLIIDGDPIVYRAGFAVERNEYHLVVEHQETGEVQELYFVPAVGNTAGAQMKEWLSGNRQWSVISKEHIVIPEPVENALEAVRTQLYSIEKECREYYGVERFKQVTLLLSGPGNYREQLATIFPYKGNRDPQHKPRWYQRIRDYLTGEWGAIVVNGREADDECSIIAHECIQAGRQDSYVIATIDKDLDQIPGEHYNYHKQVFYNQTPIAAARWFYQQCLSGDATDGIPGCYKLGAIGAARITDKCSDKQIKGRDIWPIIVEQYRKSTKKAGCPYVGRDPAAVALETARLVKLQEYPGQLWNPNGKHDLLPEYVDE